MSRCASLNCGYYWKDEDDDFPRCHCPDDGFPAPCESDDDDDWDDEPGDIDDDCGFDPYEGCYTYDC